MERVAAVSLGLFVPPSVAFAEAPSGAAPEPPTTSADSTEPDASAPPVASAPFPASPYAHTPPAAAGRAQEETPKRAAYHVVFAELLGNGIFYSLNYERLLEGSDFGVRMGAGYMSLSGGSGSATTSAAFLTFPLLFNYYGVGGRNHKLQLGAGATLLYFGASGNAKSSFAEISGFVPAPTLAVGYRYLPEKGGFNFFIGFTPLVIPTGDPAILPWGGISFGGVF